MEYVKPERIWLKNSPDLNEKWLQKKIAEDPSILGLDDDLVLLDKERPQPAAGRLDLLLQNRETKERYEVEIQLGSTDESHIIRTIEYWDIERKRFPQYDHIAVIVAEEITNRFFNVISLFNGSIPLIAIQIQAIKIVNNISLVATTVLDRIERGVEDEEVETAEITDRNYWERRATKESVAMADELLRRVQKLNPSLELKYNKFYIGLARNDQGFNFVSITPKKKHAWLNVKIPSSPEITERLEAENLDARYDKGFKEYVIRLTEKTFDTNTALLDELISDAYKRRVTE